MLLTRIIISIFGFFSRLRKINILLYFISFVSFGFIIYCLLPVEFGLKIDEARVVLNFVLKEQQKMPGIFKKVQEMNANLENMRKLILKVSNFSGPVLGLPQVTLVDEKNPNYTDIIKNFSCVSNVNLTWNKTKIQPSSKFDNVLKFSDDSQFEIIHQWLVIEKYYTFTGSKLLCEYVRGGITHHRIGYIYNYTCNTDIKVASIPTQINPLLFHTKHTHTSAYSKDLIVPSYCFEMPTVYRVMQIFTRSVLSPLGEAYCGNLQVIPYDCLPAPSSQPSNSSISTFAHHDEVFVISQRWGESYFHKMIENIPRTALFLDFLRKYPNIKILARDNSERLLEILETLGLSRDRIITGWIRADIAYVPRTTTCGIPTMLDLQFFQHYNLQFIAQNLLGQKHIKRSNLILIVRSGSRRFTNYPLIEQLLNKTAMEFGFKFVLFKDNPPPSLKETMIMFSMASIVVAPHGAGLSNLVFGRPGTLVIEGLCNLYHTNPCYQRTAYALGMRWHGIISTSGCEGVVDVDGKEIDFVLRSYIRIISADKLKS